MLYVRLGKRIDLFSLALRVFTDRQTNSKDKMRAPVQPLEADQVLPEPKQFLTEEQLIEIWDLRGLKYRMDDLHIQFLSRGLNVSVDRVMFRTIMYELLGAFLIRGEARLPSSKAPIPRFPKVF